MRMTMFSPSGKYRVNSDENNCFQDKPICRGYLSKWQTLLYAQSLMSELYFEIEVKLKNTIFVNRVLYHNKIFNKRI